MWIPVYVLYIGIYLWLTRQPSSNTLYFSLWDPLAVNSASFHANNFNDRRYVFLCSSKTPTDFLQWYVRFCVAYVESICRKPNWLLSALYVIYVKEKTNGIYGSFILLSMIRYLARLPSFHHRFHPAKFRDHHRHRRCVRICRVRPWHRSPCWACHNRPI